MGELEKEILKGQMLQGTLAAREVHDFLVTQGAVDGNAGGERAPQCSGALMRLYSLSAAARADFPLFKVIYEIAFEGKDVRRLLTDI